MEVWKTNTPEEIVQVHSYDLFYFFLNFCLSNGRN